MKNFIKLFILNRKRRMSSIFTFPTKNNQQFSLQNRNIAKVEATEAKTATKQFSNPIYAGFQSFEDTKESSLWGPWMAPREITPLKKSHSLNNKQKFQCTNIEFRKSPNLSVQKKAQKNENPNPSLPRNELPCLRQRNLQSLKQIRYSSLQLNPKQIKTPEKHPQVKKLRIYPDKKKHDLNMKIREEYVKKGRALGDNGRQYKMNTVMFNYCTYQNVERGLLKHRRKNMGGYMKEEQNDGDSRKNGEKFIQKMRNINLF